MRGPHDWFRGRRASVAPLALLLALASLFWTATAGAQVSLGPVVVGRPTPSDLAPHRTTAAQPSISYLDCITSVRDFQRGYGVQFQVNVAGASTQSLQVWAAEGVDCTLGTNRTNASTGCFEIPAAAGSGIKLYARDLIRALPTVTPSTCADSATVTTGHQLTLYFLLLPSTADPVPMGQYATWTTVVDLLGPVVPMGLDLAAGDEFLVVNLPSTSDPDRQGYYVYCSPPIDDAGGGYLGDAAAVTNGSSPAASTSSSGTTAGGTDDAGAGGGSGREGWTTSTGVGGSTASAACGDAIPGLTPGVSPPPDAPVCATLNSGATSAPIWGAENGARYVVALAAYDAVNNIGPLTTSLCQTPEPTDTFFGVYCRDHGGACPGSAQCNLGRSPALTWPTLATAVLAVLALAVRRARAP